MFKRIYELNKLEFEAVCRRTVGNQLDSLLNYLAGTDFYYAPAARSYHDNYPGGLYDHCKGLYAELYNLRSKMKKNWTDLELLIIAFCHDLCKIGLYVPNIGENGLIYYTYSGPEDGHGTKSLQILADIDSNLITKRIANSIVYHMGLWTKDIPNAHQLKLEAQTEDDLVFFTHVADMISSRAAKTAKEVRIGEDGLVNISY